MTTIKFTKFIGVAVGGVGAILLAMMVGVMIGNLIPHEHQFRTDPFQEQLIFWSIFTCGLIFGIARRLYLLELWASAGIAQIIILLIIFVCTGSLGINNGHFIRESRVIVIPFISSLLLLHSFSSKKYIQVACRAILIGKITGNKLTLIDGDGKTINKNIGFNLSSCTFTRIDSPFYYWLTTFGNFLTAIFCVSLAMCAIYLLVFNP